MLAAESEDRLRLIGEAYGILNPLPETGFPFRVSTCAPGKPSLSGIMRPLEAPKLEAAPQPTVVPARKVPALSLVTWVVAGVGLLVLAGLMMHVLRPEAPAAAAAQVEAAADALKPHSLSGAVQEGVRQDTPPLPAGPAAATLRSHLLALKALPFGELLARALEGDPQAQWQAAQAYQNGAGVEASAEEAFKWTLMAADQGLPAAQMQAGLCYKKGAGVAQELTQALQWFQRASAAGLEDASQESAWCLLNGGESMEDHVKAVALLRPLAEKGHAGAQEQLGICHRHGKGTPVNLDEAIRCLLPAAEHGHAQAQLELGLAYTGKGGTPGNLAAAAMWYRRAAQQQEPEAQYLLGEACFSGQGVPQSREEAVQWWRLAAEQDHDNAQDSLGMAYQRGLGVHEDASAAARWYRKAAAHDHAAAKFHLSVCHTLGAGVPEDKAQAAHYCLEAAELGHVAAQNSLGIFYLEGTGVRKDAAEALKWFTLASAQGDETAAQWLAKLKAAMPPSQVAAGESRARAFTPRKRRQGQELAAQTPSTQPLATDSSLHPDVLLTNHFQGFGGKGRLILENGLTDDVYVKVVGGSKLWASFHVRGGGRLTLNNVPDGSYHVIYCTGIDWDPMARDFGRDQHAMRYDQNLDFTTTRTVQGTQTTVSTPVITVTLHAASNLEARGKNIPLEEFNRF